MFGCAGGQWKTTTSVGGRTTVRGDEKTMEQERLRREQETSRIEAIKKAERRKPTDPIVVALYRPEISENLQKSIRADMLFDILRKEFERDGIIIVVKQSDVDKAQAEAARQNKYRMSSQKARPSVPADVSVFTCVSHKETVGISRSSGKLGKMTALVLSGEVVSHYLPEDHYKVEKSDNIFKNVELTKEYAREVIQTIKTRPAIPGQAFKKKMQEEQAKALLDAIKGIMKPQKPQS
ncbi:MAG: hypothetical protein ACMUIL_03850 [bacterium]